jgi:hypothetical protein
MSRYRPFPNRACAVLGALLLASGVAACDEDGKTAPARCADPPLPIFDIQNAGAPADDNARYNDDDALPCVTEVGHGVGKPIEVAGSATGGTSTAGTGGVGGTLPSAGGAPADAGSGGAPADAGAGGS